MSRCGIICAGNWIVDIVHQIGEWPRESDLARIEGQEMDIGGGAANVTSALTKLDTGLPLWPMGAVGEDDYGNFILNRCVEMGLPTELLRVKAGVASAHTHVMSVTGKSRTFFYQGGASDALSAADFGPNFFRSSSAKIFYLGYLTLLAELDRVTDEGITGAATVLQRARKASLITCVDLVSVDRPDLRDGLIAALPHIDYLVLNETELARASNNPPPATHHDLDEAALIEMAKNLIKRGVKRAIILHCPEIALWIGTDGQVLRVPVVPLAPEEVASPLGAGDAFCSGVLYALHEGWPPLRALELGHAIARASLRGVKASEAIPKLHDLTDHLGRKLIDIAKAPKGEMT